MAYTCKEIIGSVIYINENNIAKVICASSEDSLDMLVVEAITNRKPEPKDEYKFFLPEHVRDKVKVGCTYKFNLMYNINAPEKSAATEAEQII